MRALRFGMLSVVVAIVAVSASCTAWRFFAYKLSPDAPSMSGTIALDGLEKPVTVVFDEFAVPHVNASSDHDLAFATGYLHARERLFQMELLRAIAYGKVAELFGDQPRDAMLPMSSTLAVDRWFRTMGLGRAGEKAAARLDAAPRAFA